MTGLSTSEQRVYGLVHIAQGVVMILTGRRPDWTLRYLGSKARKYTRRDMEAARDAATRGSCA